WTEYTKSDPVILTYLPRKLETERITQRKPPARAPELEGPHGGAIRFIQLLPILIQQVLHVQTDDTSLAGSQFLRHSGVQAEKVLNIDVRMLRQPNLLHGLPLYVIEHAGLQSTVRIMMR